MPRTEPGKWLLEEYARTPGDPKWYPGRGLESTIEAIETYSGFWECDSCGRRVEAATPAPQPDALSAEGIIGRGMDLRQFAPDRNRLISLLLTIDGAAGGNRRLSASWAFEMADELLAAGVALATPAPLDDQKDAEKGWYEARLRGEMLDGVWPGWREGKPQPSPAPLDDPVRGGGHIIPDAIRAAYPEFDSSLTPTPPDAGGVFWDERAHEIGSDPALSDFQKVNALLRLIAATLAATPAPLDVLGDDFRDRHERAMRDHILACNPEHYCDDLCSDEIITRLALDEAPDA